MPRLVIDNREIEVPEGTKVIEAAERLGIMIPRFCYHEALGSVGACRMCAVKFLQGPFKGVQMSCMIDAGDGMVVSTTDEEAVSFRKMVIEWLMLNHPHDCPVCDEGGQCLLQDETVSGGHGIRRYLGKKRTYRDQYLGPFIRHEMNRCIHCYRCSRYYQEFSGYRDLGPMQIGDRVYFGRFSDGALESPFSGNLVDICPTGVYTDKPARFKLRRWDLQRAPSLCINCSLGCNTIANAHYRAIMRIEARLNREVNGYFICDACRFGFSYTNGGADHVHRPWNARADGAPVSAQTALKTAGERLSQITQKYGPHAVASVGSARNSLETQCMLKWVCRTNKWPEPAFFEDHASYTKVRDAVLGLDDGIAVSMREIEESDFVIVVGADPLNEAAMSALAIRQAARREAAVAVIDPRPVSLPFRFEHIPAAPDHVETCLGMLVKTALGKGQKSLSQGAKDFLKDLPSKLDSREIQLSIHALAERFRESKRPVIVCGTDVIRESTPAFAADCALLLREMGKQSGIFFIFPGANAFSAALLSGEAGRSFETVLDEIEKGSVRALLAVESDPFRNYRDRARLENALSKLDLIVALDYLPTETARRASIFCPSSTVFETSSTFINQEGRVQFAKKVHQGGVPISGEHPPHVFRDFVPGGDHRPAWEILWEIAGEPGTTTSEGVPMEPGAWIAAEHPAFEQVNAVAYPVDGSKITAVVPGARFVSMTAKRGKSVKPDGMELLLVEWMFGTGEFSVYSDTLNCVIPEPVVLMHAMDAAKLGLAEGDRVSIGMDAGNIEVKLSVSEKMARGVLILPRHRDLQWQKLKEAVTCIPPERIGKV
jgi:NADH-quinone oxidoreductase subunit G